MTNTEITYHCSVCGAQVEESCNEHPAATIDSVVSAESAPLDTLGRTLAQAGLQAAADQSSAWTIVADQEALRAALGLARGRYQRHLLEGVESLSGSTLRGKARDWSGSYHRSRESLLSRLVAAGIAWTEVRRRRGGARVLVIGAEVA